jgi:hypothetical protein
MTARPGTCIAVAEFSVFGPGASTVPSRGTDATLESLSVGGKPVAGFDPAADGFKLWWQRTRWTWRNPCNGWQSELLGVADIASAFTVKRDLPLLFGYHLKLWLGWNPIKRGGNYFPFMFQIGPKRGAGQSR